MPRARGQDQPCRGGGPRHGQAQGSGGTPTYGTGDNSREGYATTPLPPVPAYPPAPGYQQPAPGYQQPQAPGHPQGPGYPQGRTGRDLAP